VTSEAPNAGQERRALLVVSAAVLLASATWFSGTAAARALASTWSLDPSAAAWLTNATQYGFIGGTILYALANLADRYNARWVFFLSAWAGAVCNLGFAWVAQDLSTALPFRFLTGMTLAGVYPVGMKIIATWFREGLGWRLGVMVGCLTLGTAFPYGVDAIGLDLDWRTMVSIASGAALLGGLLMLVGIGDGPFLRQRARLDLRMAFNVFRHPPFRNTALGYFGHMWELYALWALAGFFVAASVGDDPTWSARVPILAFATVAVGSLGCIIGGFISRRSGERKVALVSIVISGAMCASSGLAFDLPPALLLVFLLIWGTFVVSDSPQFSALAARHAPPAYTGTALTIQNGIGFLVTTASIQLVPILAAQVGWRWAFTLLTAGPILGTYFTRKVPRDA
jgi:MFS family permease